MITGELVLVTTRLRMFTYFRPASSHDIGYEVSPIEVEGYRSAVSPTLNTVGVLHNRTRSRHCNINMYPTALPPYNTRSVHPSASRF